MNGEFGSWTAGFASVTFFTWTGSNMFDGPEEDGGGFITLGADGSFPGSLLQTVSFWLSLTTFTSGSLNMSFTS